MNDLERFAKNVSFLNGNKRGRKPVFSSNMFYPYVAEMELQGATKKEFLRFISSALEVAVSGTDFADDMAELLNFDPVLPESFKEEISKVSRDIEKKALNNFSKQSEMIIGKPYYPPEVKGDILSSWEANFQMLCKSAETDAKKDIAQLVQQAKNEGWNKNRLERAVMGELPDKYKHRAELIARTESAKLNSSINRETYKNIGVEYYVWMTTIDGRERESHAAMNGLICSVSDPEVYFEENPDDPMHPIERKRTGEMVHYHPGEDFQCRCSMVAWDPFINGKYEVKELPEEEPDEKDTTALEQARQKAEEERLAKEESERKLRLMTAANKRHMERTPEQVADIQARWDERNRKIRIRKAAEKRHAERDPQKIINEMNKRLQIRAEARALIAEMAGIKGIGTEQLEEAVSTGNSKKIKKAMDVVKDKKKEILSLKYVQNPLEAAKQFDYDTVMAVENSVKAKVEKWNKYSVPLAKRKELLEYEIKYVEDKKKYESWKLASDAYKKLLEDVKQGILLESLAPKIKEFKDYSQKYKKWKNFKKWTLELEKMVNNKNGQEEIKKQLKKVEKEYDRIKKLEPAPVKVIGENGNSVTVEKYGVEDGIQKKEMPLGLSGTEKIDAIKELTLVTEEVAKDLKNAVYGFSFQWDYEIRAFQIGDKNLVSRYGHPIEQIKKKAIDIEEFIERSPKWDGGTTYRGMSLSKEALNNYIKMRDDGIPVDMRGSASWSTSEGVSGNFAKSHIGEIEKIGGVATGNRLTEKVLFVNNKNQPLGTSIRHLSNFPGEHEILCSKKSRYKITGYQYDRSSGFHYFVVEPM